MIAVALPMAVTLTLFFARARATPFGGDEPHYLIMADSLVRDRDLSLRNNYQRDFDAPTIIGRVPPHAYNIGGRWVPYHTPGLAFVLAIPFAIGGKTAAKLTLCLLTAILPWTLFVWLRRTLTARSAAWLAIGTALSVPVLFGAPLIYPDLLAGIVAIALLVWILTRLDRTSGAGAPAWAAYWLLTGLLPWLNVKFALATIVLAIAGAAAATGRQRSTADRARIPRLWLTAPLVAIGPAALLAFNLAAYHTIRGGRSAGELTTSGLRALLIFLGLHFDQSQGMFVQQPLFLVGVAALVPFVRTRPRTAALWAALYASLVVPNALELARFGTAGPDGRFGWSAAWLWMIPIGFLAVDAAARLERWTVPLVVAALAYQTALAARWVRVPALLFPRLQEQLALRDSLFPIAMRRFLPSYYLWDFRSYLTYAPNVVAEALVAAIVVAGAFAFRARAGTSTAAERSNIS